MSSSCARSLASLKSWDGITTRPFFELHGANVCPGHPVADTPPRRHAPTGPGLSPETGRGDRCSRYGTPADGASEDSGILAGGRRQGWRAVRWQPEGRDNFVRRYGRHMHGGDPLGPTEPVPPVIGAAVGCGDNVRPYGAVVWILHEQGREPAAGGLMYAVQPQARICAASESRYLIASPASPKWALRASAVTSGRRDSASSERPCCSRSTGSAATAAPTHRPVVLLMPAS